MNYQTVEVQIDHGRIVARDPESLPEMGAGLLTILRNGPIETGLRPFGLAKGQFAVPADFNDPLSEEIVREFEGA